MKIRHFSAVLIGLACSAALSYAQQAGETGLARTLPQSTSENGIDYVCGGVGDDEAASMKQAARNYNLMVTFATRSGDFLSDVNVDIVDAHGRSLVSTPCSGPIMLVKFPKGGRYRIRAEVAGRTTSGTVNIQPKAGVKTLPLVWPPGQIGQAEAPS